MKLFDWDISFGNPFRFRPYIGTKALDSWGRDLYIHILGLTLYLAWEYSSSDTD